MTMSRQTLLTRPRWLVSTLNEIKNRLPSKWFSIGLPIILSVSGIAVSCWVAYHSTLKIKKAADKGMVEIMSVSYPHDFSVQIHEKIGWRKMLRRTGDEKYRFAFIDGLPLPKKDFKLKLSVKVDSIYPARNTIVRLYLKKGDFDKNIYSIFRILKANQDPNVTYSLHRNYNKIFRDNFGDYPEGVGINLKNLKPNKPYFIGEIDLHLNRHDAMILVEINDFEIRSFQFY